MKKFPSALDGDQVIITSASAILEVGHDTVDITIGIEYTGDNPDVRLARSLTTSKLITAETPTENELVGRIVALMDELTHSTPLDADGEEEDGMGWQ